MEQTMRTKALLKLTAAMTIAVASTAAAQTKMTLRPESKVVVAGGSNVHSWSCAATGFTAAIDLDSAYAASPLSVASKPIGKVIVTIPTKSLRCGKDKMDENTWKALRAEEFKEIRYELTTYTLDAAKSTPESFTALTKGRLTVAGTTKEVEMPVTATRLAGGQMQGTGTLQMLMTEVGIKPPVALLGTLRTKDEITISFEVLLDKAVVVALTRQP
jgi:polyisoprenoid-binding protein YceI